MAEIVEYTNYTENGIFVIKKYEFCDELWNIIKQYLGLNGGINIGLPQALAKLSVVRLQTILYLPFRFEEYNNPFRFCTNTGSAVVRRKNLMKVFYKNFGKVSNQLRITDDIVKMIGNLKFKTPEDLEIGEKVLIFKNDWLDSTGRKSGVVFSKTKCQFVVLVKGQVIDEFITIRSNKFMRYRDTPHHMMYLYLI